MSYALLIIFLLWFISFVVSNANHYFYLDSWDGTNQSARYRAGGWWYGYNKRTRNWFFIHSGGFHFQLQNWKPKFIFRINK